MLMGLVVYGDSTIYDIAINGDNDRIAKISRKSDGSVLYENDRYINATAVYIKKLSFRNSDNKLIDFELYFICDDQYEKDELENKYVTGPYYHGYNIEQLKFYITPIFEKDEPVNIFYETYYEKFNEFFMNNNIQYAFFYYHDLNDFNTKTEIKNMHIKYKLLSFLYTTQKYDIIIYFHSADVRQDSIEYNDFKNKILVGDSEKYKVFFMHHDDNDINTIRGYMRSNNIMTHETCFINMHTHIAHSLYIPWPHYITFEQKIEKPYIYTTILFNNMIVRWLNFTNDIRYKPLCPDGCERSVVVIDDDEEMKQFAKCFMYHTSKMTGNYGMFKASVLILTENLSKIDRSLRENLSKNLIFHRKRT